MVTVKVMVGYWLLDGSHMVDQCIHIYIEREWFANNGWLVVDQ